MFFQIYIRTIETNVCLSTDIYYNDRKYILIDIQLHGKWKYITMLGTTMTNFLSNSKDGPTFIVQYMTIYSIVHV